MHMCSCSGMLCLVNSGEQGIRNDSASTNMAQPFTGRRSVFFWLKIFYTQIRFANLYFSRAGNSKGSYHKFVIRFQT